jgi:MFS family permease
MWFFIGVATSSLFGAMLTDAFGFRVGQWISVAVIAVTALSWFLFLPETRKAKEAPADPGQQIQAKSREKLPWRVIATTSFTSFIARFMSWGILAATGIIWLSNIFGDGASIMNVFIPIATLTGLYSALSNLTSIASTPLAGTLSDRFGRRWPVIAISMILGGLGLWLMSGEIMGLALIGALFVPIAGSSTETLIPAITGDRVPKGLRSRALGLINTAGDLGAMIGPFAALGAINSGLLKLDSIYRIGGLLFVVVAVMALSPLVSKRDSTGNENHQE